MFREFYEERDVVHGGAADAAPRASRIGRLFEQFTTAAFEAHPYQQPAIGYLSDLQSLTITDAENFFQHLLRPVEPGHGDRRRRPRRGR